VTQLAPNFSFAELTRTSHRDLLDENAAEGLDYVDALTALADMLQSVRDYFCSPLIVHSGFRCEALNNAVGGSKYSQHSKGEAADFHIIGVPLPRVFDWIRNESDLKYGQLILEGIRNGEPTWIHMSLGEPWRKESKSRQALLWDKDNGYRRA